MSQNPPLISRRRFLSAAGVLASAAVGGARLSGESGVAGSPRLRVAHLTDSHVFDNWGCEQKFGRLIEALASIRPAPDLILHTGDVIMDGLVEPTRSDVKSQWKLWHKLAKGLPPAETRYILGNHDTWMNETGSEPHRGKRLALDELRLTTPYYAFERGGWRFIMLDSVRPIFEELHFPYDSRLDATQREWLLAELRATADTTPLVVCTHVPILSVGVFAGAQLVAGRWTLSGPGMHADSHELQAVLRARKGRTLCLSGHLHVTDDVVYDGVHYLGCGAVCGDWWKHSVYYETPAGFSILDLSPDGQWNRSYHESAWPV